jgi:hypothetical protein
MLFEKIQLDDVQIPGAIDKIKVDCQFKSIYMTAESWIVDYQLFVAGTEMAIKSGNVVLQTHQPGFEGLLTLEGLIERAATEMMPMMLARLS